MEGFDWNTILMIVVPAVVVAVVDMVLGNRPDSPESNSLGEIIRRLIAKLFGSNTKL